MYKKVILFCLGKLQIKGKQDKPVQVRLMLFARTPAHRRSAPGCSWAAPGRCSQGRGQAAPGALRAGSRNLGQSRQLSVSHVASQLSPGEPPGQPPTGTPAAPEAVVRPGLHGSPGRAGQPEREAARTGLRHSGSTCFGLHNLGLGEAAHSLQPVPELPIPSPRESWASQGPALKSPQARGGPSLN